MGYRATEETEVVPLEGAEGFVRVEAEEEAQAIEDATLFARIGYYAIPVALVHLGLLYTVLSGVFDLDLPRFTTSNPFLAWLWLNGAAVALAVWMWRAGRFPVRPTVWLRGRTAKLLIVGWLALSIGWFTMPAFVRELARLFTGGNGSSRP